MADNSQPSDVPKLNVTVEGPWGQQVQKVEADTNRVTPAAEFQKGWAELLNLPPSVADTLLQASCFVGIGAFPASVLLTLPPTPVVIVPLALTIFALVFAACVAVMKYPNLQPALIYRGLLLAAGIMLGVIAL